MRNWLVLLLIFGSAYAHALDANLVQNAMKDMSQSIQNKQSAPWAWQEYNPIINQIGFNNQGIIYAWGLGSALAFNKLTGDNVPLKLMGNLIEATCLVSTGSSARIPLYAEVW